MLVRSSGARCFLPSSECLRGTRERHGPCLRGSCRECAPPHARGAARDAAANTATAPRERSPFSLRCCTCSTSRDRCPRMASMFGDRLLRSRGIGSGRQRQRCAAFCCACRWHEVPSERSEPDHRCRSPCDFRGRMGGPTSVPVYGPSAERESEAVVSSRAARWTPFSETAATAAVVAPAVEALFVHRVASTRTTA